MRTGFETRERVRPSFACFRSTKVSKSMYPPQLGQSIVEKCTVYSIDDTVDCRRRYTQH